MALDTCSEKDDIRKIIHIIKVTKSLRDNKSLDLPKSNAISDDKVTINQIINFVFHKVENIVGKVENADYQHDTK